ncbi:hypothetical protein [uncultured Fusobacterium sp.]|uniref:hypothetical protein n=1 Tax=uncultured Fusobacterium sp. TaxID=159267 RepID=UPI0025F969EB|nr:hypothetical protein [uncultured Fusobacterium sp.]
MNNIGRIEKNILSELINLLGDKYNYYRGYIPEKKYKDKIEGNDKYKELPFVLIRAGRITTAKEGGIYTKKISFIVRVAIENKALEEGYLEILEVTDKIINFLENNYFKTKGYDIDLNEKIVANSNQEVTAGDYWGYDIEFTLNTGSTTPGSLLKARGL